MKRQPTITDIIMLAGGAVTFLASFLTFWDAGDDQSAWGELAFPTFTIPAILGLAMAVLVLLEWFMAPTLPKVLTFDWKQIYVTWGVVSLVIVLSAFVLRFPTGADINTGMGTILMLLGSAAMTAGAVMRILGVANDPLGGAATAPGALQAPGGYPAQPGGAYPPQQPGYTPAPPAGQYPPQGQTTPPPPPPPPAGGASTPPPPPPV